MTERAPLRITSRERYMRAIHDELVKFERKEADFRKKVREERTAELHIPIKQIEALNQHQASK